MTGFLVPILCQSLAVDLKQKGVKVEIELFVSMSCRRRRRQRHNVAVDSETLKNFYPGKKGTVSLPCMVGLVDCGWNVRTDEATADVVVVGFFH